MLFPTPSNRWPLTAHRSGSFPNTPGYLPRSSLNCPLALVMEITRSMAMIVSNLSLRACVSPPIREALAVDLLENGNGTLLIIHAKGLAVVIAEVKLIHVALQVLFRHALVNARKPALEDGEETLRRVGVDTAGTDIFIARVANGF